MSKLTNVVVQEFLADFEANAETTILEEGKEKNELAQIAKARGMSVKGSRDLALFKTIYAFTDVANENGAILPKKELLKALPQIIGKPVNINHDRRLVVGHYVDYRYKEKDSKIVAYGVFYKSYFAKEWEAAQNLFRKKKLSSSFEIWSPKDKRKEKEDGSYELYQMEIAGGALIYEDDENTPAFKDAKVLALAKKEEPKAELVYASKYKEEEIITSKKDVEKSEEVEETPPETQVVKLKCSNCSEEFEISGFEAHYKCPKCFAIVNKEGSMVYPPQIKDFKLLCPACKVNNWLILSNKEDKSKIRCLSCAKEYNISFKKDETSEAIEKLTFLYSGTAHCIQCGTGIVFEGSSKLKQREFKCPKCGLQFTHDTSKTERNRTIASIQEIEVKPIDKEMIKSKEGGKTMELDKKKIEKADEKKEDKVNEPKVEEKKEEQTEPKAEEKTKEKVEDKATDKPAKESSEEVEAPKAEEKVEEPKTTEKVEDTPKEEKSEEKTDVTPADIEYEEQFENKVEDAYDITISKVIEFAKFDDSIADLETAKKKDELAKKLTYQERKNMPDSSFAVVVTVKNKKTDKTRKVRKYPINDKAHVRNTLARLSQDTSKKTLSELGVSIDSIREKILARAKKLGMQSLLKRYRSTAQKAQEKAKVYKSGINKLAKELIEAKKQIQLYKDDAITILTRREELGDFAKELKDEDILNDEKFEKAKLVKENTLLKASQQKDDDIVGGAKKDTDFYAEKRNEIDKYAFGE